MTSNLIEIIFMKKKTKVKINMKKEDIQFKIDQLRKDKMIYALESIALTFIVELGYILVMLITLIATPCFAQEIEPDGIFSIEGTTWWCIGIAFYSSEPFIRPFDDTVYFPDLEGRYYGDFLVFSIGLGQFYTSYPYYGSGIGILQPTIGIGMFELLMWKQIYTSATLVGVGFGLMFKIDDDDWWLPPEVE